MSFEGYDQNICPNGHFWENDVYHGQRTCPYCQQKPVWINTVDQTNGEDDGYVEPTLKHGQHVSKCGKCGSVLKVVPEIYEIPQ